MLHPTLERALVTAHIEDLHRAAVKSRSIRLARRVALEPHVAAGDDRRSVRKMWPGTGLHPVGHSRRNLDWGRRR